MRCYLAVLSLFFSALVFSQSDTSKIVFAEDVWLGQELPLKLFDTTKSYDENYFGIYMDIPEKVYDIFLNVNSLKIWIEEQVNNAGKFGVEKGAYYINTSNQQNEYRQLIKINDSIQVAEGVKLSFEAPIRIKNTIKSSYYIPDVLDSVFCPNKDLYSSIINGQFDFKRTYNSLSLLASLNAIKSQDINLISINGSQRLHVNDKEILLDGVKLKSHYNIKNPILSISKNVRIKTDGDRLSLKDIDFLKTLTITATGDKANSSTRLYLSDCTVKGNFQVWGSVFVLGITNSRFSGYNYIGLSHENVSVYMDGSSFDITARQEEIRGNSLVERDTLGNYVFCQPQFRYIAKKTNDFKINDCVFKGNGSSAFLSLNSEFTNLLVNESIFSIPIYLSGKIGSRISIEENVLNGHGVLLLNDLELPENPLNIDISWSQIRGNKLNIRVPYFSVEASKKHPRPVFVSNHSDQFYREAFTVYKAIENIELMNYRKYLKYIENFQFICNLYKTKGHVLEANKVLIELKDAEMRRLRYVYESEGGLKNWFRWWLSWLLKTYTEHGTDPAKALVISFWIIISFSVFYFFFPSDWDLYSKSAIIKNFRQALDKNDKKIFTPFLKAVLYFLVSFANAFTLSINSFVTLGFGQIPARGVAKYVTILQGFMGWFLLSIFSVALINQVLG